MKTTVIVLACVLLAACDKVSVGQRLNRVVGNWAELQVPAGCKPKQISVEEGSGVAVLCEDGRIFH